MTQVWVSCQRRIVAGATLGMLLLIGAASAHAQAVGSGAMRGRIVDESGAGIPGVTVTVSSPSLQLRERTIVSELDGEYQIRSLPLGTYSMKFELGGFQTILREGIQLSAGIRSPRRHRAEAVHGAGNHHRERPEPGHRRRPRPRSART